MITEPDNANVDRLWVEERAKDASLVIGTSRAKRVAFSALVILMVARIRDVILILGSATARQVWKAQIAISANRVTTVSVPMDVKVSLLEII